MGSTSSKSETEFPYDPEIILLSLHPKEVKIRPQPIPVHKYPLAAGRNIPNGHHPMSGETNMVLTPNSTSFSSKKKCRADTRDGRTWRAENRRMRENRYFRALFI